MAETISSQLQLLSEGISTSVEKISVEVNKMEDGGENQSTVQLLRLDLQAINDRIEVNYNSVINQYVTLVNDTEAKEKEMIRSDFIRGEKSRIDNLLILLSKRREKLFHQVTSHTLGLHQVLLPINRSFLRRLILVSGMGILSPMLTLLGDGKAKSVLPTCPQNMNWTGLRKIFLNKLPRPYLVRVLW